MLCTGITIEPRSRWSLSSHSSQPIVQRAAECIRHIPENTICTHTGIADGIADADRSSACASLSSKLEPALPSAGRQSGREVIANQG